MIVSGLLFIVIPELADVYRETIIKNHYGYDLALKYLIGSPLCV
jgi:hypothetical protein